MLAAIGIILISKQIPLLLGYDKADFWTKELFNVFSLDHAFDSCKKYLLSQFGRCSYHCSIYPWACLLPGNEPLLKKFLSCLLLLSSCCLAC